MRNVRDEVAAVRAWYEATAVSFRLRYEGTGGEFWQLFEEVPALELLGRPGGRVLDLGCGPGRLALPLARLASRTVAVDVAYAMAALGRAQRPPANVSYCVMDAAGLALASESCDAVISLGMFEYMADPSPFLSEVHRVLRPGGAVVFSAHNRPATATRAFMFAAGALRGAFRPQSARAEGVARDQAYRIAEHDASRMLRHLVALGFESPELRGFNCPVTELGFAIAATMAGTRAVRRGLALVDRWLGRRSWARQVCGLALYRARKPS